MSGQRVCLTVAADRAGWPRDEECWTTLDVEHEYPAWVRTCDAFVAYLAERGIELGGLHVGTEDWVRAYAERFA